MFVSIERSLNTKFNVHFKKNKFNTYSNYKSCVVYKTKKVEKRLDVVPWQEITKAV